MGQLALVIGAGGMIGSHLAERLMCEGQDVVGTSYMPTIRLDELPQSLEIIELDIRNGDQVAALLRRLRPDRIFHLAAQSYPTVSWKLPIETIETNVIGTTHIFEAIRALRSEDPAYDPLIVSACSSAEYGASLARASGPVSEDTELLPLHPYGVTKVATDLLTYQYFEGFGIRGKRARIFNTSGPRKRGDVISDFARRIAKLPEEGGTLRVGNLSTRRAFLHVFDMVDALLRLSISGRDGEAYNISGTEVVSIGELLPMFEEASGKTIKPDIDPTLLRPTDEPIIVGDNNRIFTDTGWSPKHSVTDIVRDVYAYEWGHRHAEPA
jgi:nucleoside-diphosphate-sugar epimerase